mmetsp:Transcript_15899/g.28840  ORF Transcript_15899/g.28840 Transcript_15899/m.28840 type:complete len:112 (+) Transcript_15899:399-734(+)|eukprot:CAMPEP_0201907578 /NCGR_PEP_ID=MMETSP0902-20130614/57603_1 /ASSEMBLY_ACC=CAM_ASM_000551 /TAXON_ID=420261 /ORGANISM="Thalassiosira antarctica, Strain CCMP982" /LENGTH=111 /DNA_ID=CAMNT_0048441735 /DNA_START=728 /DNA_END=1060 /DNA_ORIENTATION=+
MVNQIGVVFLQAEKIEFEYEFAPTYLCELPEPNKYVPPMPLLAAATRSMTEPSGSDPFATEKPRNFEGNLELDATPDDHPSHKQPPHIALGYKKGEMVALLNSFGSNGDRW